MQNHAELILAMISYDSGFPKRIQHFLKVHNFARTIGLLEGLDGDALFTLEAAAIVHDIGIKLSESKYGDCAGKHQELEGPPEARAMLESLGYPAGITDRVCYLVGRHHTYDDIQGPDYQILVEADFLVNLFENASSIEAIQNALRSIFRTPTGIKLCKEMFGLSEN